MPSEGLVSLADPEIAGKSIRVKTQAKTDSALASLNAECEECSLADSRFFLVFHRDKPTQPIHNVAREVYSPGFDQKNYLIICRNCACLDDSQEPGFQNKWQFFSKLGDQCECCKLRDPTRLLVEKVGATRMSADTTRIRLCMEFASGAIQRHEIQLVCANCLHGVMTGGCSHGKASKKATKIPSVITGGRNMTARPVKVSTKEIKANQIPFDFADLQIRAEDRLGPTQHFLEEHHYAQYGRVGSGIYSASLNSELIAVCKFASPVRQGIAGSVGMEDGQVLELDRFCIHPARHKKNFASYFMARVLKLFKRDYPHVLKLVSFADPRVGHDGGIYKASNWDCLGETSKGYYYLDLDGNEVNKKSLYEQARSLGVKERDHFEALGFKRVPTPKKIKFVLDLRKGSARILQVRDTQSPAHLSET